MIILLKLLYCAATKLAIINSWSPIKKWINNLVIDNIKINEIIIELKTNDNKQKDEIKI